MNEVNNEMESLSNELDKTLSFIDHKSIDREKYELQDLLNKAKELTRIIDINESKKKINSFNLIVKMNFIIKEFKQKIILIKIFNIIILIILILII